MQKQQYPIWLDNFINVYQSLTTDNLHLLDSVYHQELRFIDPMHEVKGLPSLHRYFNSLYENLTQCQFLITKVIHQENEAAIYWQMHFVHKKLNRGKQVLVTGHSQLSAQQGKIIFHRDYLDLGQMLYEQLPVIGSLVKLIKQRAVANG